MRRSDAERLVGKDGTWHFRQGNVIGRCIGIEERRRGARSTVREPRFVFVGIHQPIISTWLDDFIEFRERSTN